MTISHFTGISIFTLALVSACGGASGPPAGDKAAAKGGTVADAKDGAPADEVPKLTINEAD